MSLFTLDDMTLESFGLVPNPGHGHEAAPGTRDKLLTIPGMDGVYDFGSDLTERKFNFPLTFAYETNRYYLQQKVREFVAFLSNGYGKPRDMKLKFLYEPDVYYNVRRVGELPISRMLNLGEFNLPLMAPDPRAYLVVNAIDIITLESDITLDRGIRLDDEFSFAITGNRTLEINNFGTLNLFPLIEITGSFTTLSITANGKSFGYTEAIASQTLTIDGKKKTVKIGTTNKLSKMTGAFTELLSGVNSISISGTGLNCTIKFIFKPQFL